MLKSTKNELSLDNSREFPAAGLPIKPLAPGRLLLRPDSGLIVGLGG